jgi:COMPASS component SWD1
MNASLLSTSIRRVASHFTQTNIIRTDPFIIAHPTAVQTSLVSGASFARFNPSGQLLAAARSDGSAVVWDLDTRATIRWCEGHVKGVTAIECVQPASY